MFCARRILDICNPGLLACFIRPDISAGFHPLAITKPNSPNAGILRRAEDLPWRMKFFSCCIVDIFPPVLYIVYRLCRVVVAAAANPTETLGSATQPRGVRLPGYRPGYVGRCWLECRVCAESEG